MEICNPPQILGTRFSWIEWVFLSEKHGFDQVYPRKSRKTQKYHNQSIHVILVFQTYLLRRGSAQKMFGIFVKNTFLFKNTKVFQSVFALKNIFTFFVENINSAWVVIHFLCFLCYFSFSSRSSSWNGPENLVFESIFARNCYVVSDPLPKHVCEKIMCLVLLYSFCRSSP